MRRGARYFSYGPCLWPAPLRCVALHGRWSSRSVDTALHGPPLGRPLVRLLAPPAVPIHVPEVVLAVRVALPRRLPVQLERADVVLRRPVRHRTAPPRRTTPRRAKPCGHTAPHHPARRITTPPNRPQTNTKGGAAVDHLAMFDSGAHWQLLPVSLLAAVMIAIHEQTPKGAE